MTGTEKHIALVCNPTRENAKSLQVADEVVQLLKRKGVPHSLFTAYWPQQFDEFSDVWILGGDGTLNCFINQFPDLELPLSVFPGGSGNDFHWMLYGDMATGEQVEVLLAGTTVAVDAGSCNGQLFLNGVGIGFDGAIVNDLLGKKKLAGKASYLLSILKNIIGYGEKACTIRFDDKLIEEECFLISIANGKRYGGGFMVAPRASVWDAVLDISVVGKIAPLKRMRFLPLIEKGEHLQLPFVQYHQSEKFNIRTAAKVHAHIDGEYLHEDSFDIKALAKRFLFSV